MMPVRETRGNYFRYRTNNKPNSRHRVKSRGRIRTRGNSALSVLRASVFCEDIPFLTLMYESNVSIPCTARFH